MSYNGWSNRETWAVNVNFNPESVSDLHTAKDMLEEAYDNTPDFLHDFINIDLINWEELKESLENDDDDEDDEDEDDDD